mmetsp:Transcript_7670/g.31991  ORF Transcript_7670/g.31991 Transcript_7670/m.31991 type:complete len:202 (-) Transcript_7670:498-1103(-)
MARLGVSAHVLVRIVRAGEPNVAPRRERRFVEVPQNQPVLAQRLVAHEVRVADAVVVLEPRIRRGHAEVQHGRELDAGDVRPVLEVVLHLLDRRGDVRDVLEVVVQVVASADVHDERAVIRHVAPLVPDGFDHPRKVILRLLELVRGPVYGAVGLLALRREHALQDRPAELRLVHHRLRRHLVRRPQTSHDVVHAVLAVEL